METLVDWAPRKRNKPTGTAGIVLDEAPTTSFSSGNLDDTTEPAEEEAPFAFVRKKNRCRLACCTALGPEMFDQGQAVHGQQTLTIRDCPAVFFIPPPCEVSWFSGLVCSAEALGEKEVSLSGDEG